MASLLIRNVDERIKRRLKLRAFKNGRSMEEEARTLIAAGLAQPEASEETFVAAVRRIVEPIGGIELELPPRETMRDPPLFD